MQPEAIIAIISGVATIIAALIGVYAKSKKRDDAESAGAERAKFWDALSNTIVILYGAEYTEGKVANDHPRLSPRDLKATETILAFLARRYPKKVIVPLQAPQAGWQVLLREDTDLIIVGGFVANIEFARHRSIYQQNFRLKMGHLCRLEERRVYRVGLTGSSASTIESLRRQPQAIEDLPSKYVSRDFAFVCNTRGYIYGSNRRVIVIAGIKGNGTLGAAMHLTRDERDSSQPNTILEKPLSRDDTLELVIQTDIINGTVNKMKTVEAMLNGKSILDNSIGLWESCKRGQFCKDCTLGEESPGSGMVIDKAESELESRERARIAAIIFDLDDTLVNTFSMLITPIELEAAKMMLQADQSLPDPDQLAALLLKIRKENPAQIKEELVRRIPDIDSKALEARQEVLEARRETLTNLMPYSLSIDPEVRLLLRDLSSKYDLYLLTEGNRDFQNAKTDHLEIRAFFKEVEFASAGPESKQKSIASLLKRHSYTPSSVLIIGNRLDKEIRAGNTLGITTIWVKHGEGCAMSRGKHTGRPNHTVEDVRELRELLNRLGYLPQIIEKIPMLQRVSQANIGSMGAERGHPGLL